MNIAKPLLKRMQKFKVLYTLRTTINADRNTRNTQYKPLVAKDFEYSMQFNYTCLELFQRISGKISSHDA